MNINQANRILDEHKERQCHSLLTVTRALWLTGDLSEMDGALFETSERPSLESTDMVQCERVRC